MHTGGAKDGRVRAFWATAREAALGDFGEIERARERLGAGDDLIMEMVLT